MHCTSLFKYIHVCFKMGNIPYCCGIISKHMYQLLLHQMAQVRMKITRPPSITTVLETVTILYFKIQTSINIYIICTCTYRVLYKFAKIFTNYMENPVLPPYIKKNLPYPPPPPAPTLDWMIQVIQSTPPPFQNFVADVNKYFGIELPENKFFVPSSCSKQSVPI